IITQKWIAMYPEGCEAWAEQRRTGYPRLFPVRLNHSKGYIDTETMIRRLPFPAVLATSDPEQYAALVAELGGEDHGGTRLWWDAGRNF
ncbi:MAG: SusD/RagB family nutrient-binding outer membrane lipoprotein, partial [Alistipes onderdonkii]